MVMAFISIFNDILIELEQEIILILKKVQGNISVPSLPWFFYLLDEGYILIN